MTWHLIYTKLKMEGKALDNLKNQGYECYLPLMKIQKRIRNQLMVSKVPLFPRYMFVNLNQDFFAKSWGPIRSTKGVSGLVKFGSDPAIIDEEVIKLLRFKEEQYASNIEPLFKVGETLRILSGPFKNLESIYQGMSGEERVIVLLEFMKKNTLITLDLDKVRLER